jgi:hypothetical protein
MNHREDVERALAEACRRALEPQKDALRLPDLPWPILLAQLEATETDTKERKAA